MGSIAAVLSARGAPSSAVARRMLAAAPHRESSHEALVLHHCVLAASGSNGTGASVGRHGAFGAAVAGVVDNLSEVCESLPARSRPARTSPAEVLAAAFGVYADAAPARLRGAYAAVVTDGDRLWCFRDHLGFGSLFYRREPHGFYAGTEAKQVVVGAGIPKEPDLDVVERIFWGTYDDSTPSALKGVTRLPKSTILAVDGSAARVRRYWDPGSLLEATPIPPDEIEARFEHLMERAVIRTMRGADVVSLSGGIDSPAVAAFGAPAHQDLFGSPLSALSAVYPDAPSVDELPYIKMVAEHLGMPLHTIQYRGGTMDRLREWVDLFDGPVPALWFSDLEEHYRRANELGFETVLTGELAEHVVDVRRYLLPYLLLHGRFGALVKHVAGQRRKGVSVGSLVRQLGHAFAPAPLARWYERARPSYPRAEIPDWIDIGRVKNLAASTIRPASERWSALQLVAFEGPGLAMEADGVLQAACGVRARRPWADVDLWEFFLGLPAEQKFPDVQSKGLVRKLLRGRVPDVVLSRQDKTVFDESLLARMSYSSLRRWLVDSPHRVPGVDYARLEERLARGDFRVADYIWARNLAGAHAFLSLW